VLLAAEVSRARDGGHVPGASFRTIEAHQVTVGDVGVRHGGRTGLIGCNQVQSQRLQRLGYIFVGEPGVVTFVEEVSNRLCAGMWMAMQHRVVSLTEANRAGLTSYGRPAVRVVWRP